ncbi:hypothetical protein [Aureivirga sp. CE67]|uniref:hypothetical protein n=1 Tax=Aureivirga sp. CE67 TaxID=1788983 RepID=UPI0018C91766|nr:hypothetical protein [Aureivirga sp. CE67]
MKNKLLKLSFIPVIALLFMSFVIQEDWFHYTSEKFGYEVDFPQKPLEQNTTLNTEIGPLEMNYSMVQETDLNADNMVYMVNYTVYPSDKISSDNKEMIDGFLRGAVDGAVRNVGGKLLTEKELSYKGYPGREITIDFQNGTAVIRMRVYLVNNVNYILQTISKAGKADNPNANKFMNSFELIEK